MPASDLQHRPAEAADLPAIVQFPQSAEELFYCFPRARWPLDVSQLASAMAERQDSTLILLDRRPAAFANFYQCQPGEYCALGNLMVAPWARQRGIAAHLVGLMEQRARKQHQARELRVSCFNGNSAGLLLYPRLGYQPYALVERQDWLGRRVALIQFSKALS